MHQFFISTLLFCSIFSFSVLAQSVNSEVENPQGLVSGTITGVDPGSATIPELLTVEISGSGTHFAMGTGTSVWFTQGSSTIFSPNSVAVNNLLLQAEMLFTNYHEPGYYDVNTYNQYDGYLILPDGFYLNENPNPPMLTDVTPGSGQAGEIAILTITGQFTNFTQAYNYVYLTKPNASGLSATFVTVLDDETLEAEVHVPTTSTEGFYNLYVSNAWDGTIGLINAFEILPDPDPPYLTGVDPDNGTIPESLTVTISGVNTHFNQGTGTFVTFRQGSSSIIYPVSVSPQSDTEIDASFMFDNLDSPGYYDVRTYSALDGTLELYNAFYLYPNPNPPMLVSIDPDQAEPGQTLDVEISGQNTSFTQGTGTIVWLNKESISIYPNNVTAVNDELLDVNLYIGLNVPTGLYTVNALNNADGLLTLPDAFDIGYLAPQLLSVVPDHGYIGDIVQLQVSGENTHFLDASYLAAWLYNSGSGISTMSLTPVSNTLMEVEFELTSASEPGLWDVYVENDIDGEISLIDAFEIIDTVSVINNHTYPFKVQVTPNPGRGVFNIAIESFPERAVKLSVMNQQGLKIEDFSFSEKAFPSSQIDLSPYPGGVYLFHFYSQGYSISQKVVIAR